MTKEELKNTYLDANEDILWYDTPDRVSLLQRSDLVLVPITLFFGGFLLSYCYASFVLMLEGKSTAFALSGITLLFIALYLIFGRIWYRYKRTSCNVYVVTDRRCLVISTLRGRIVQELPLDRVTPEVFQNTLFLGEKLLASDIVYGLGLDIFFHNVTGSPAFYAISNGQQVQKIIKRAKKNAKKGYAHDTDDFI